MMNTLPSPGMHLVEERIPIHFTMPMELHEIAIIKPLMLM